MLDSGARTCGPRLREVLPGAEFLGADDLEIVSCSGDSRHIKPGDLFVALTGTEHDGHDCIEEASRRGAAALLVERPVPRYGLPICLTSDTREAYGKICHALVGDPSQRLKVIGVTGTNGKTTTSHLIAGILRAAGRQVATMGTLGWFDGLESGPSSHTTPPAPVVANWMADAAANGCSFAVLEVSSHALAQRRIAGVNFDSACFTNFRRDHLDFHGTLACYHAAKARLAELVSPEGFIVYNADDAGSVRQLSTCGAPALTFSLGEGAEVTGIVLERHKSEQTFLLSAGSDSAIVRTTMIGNHHVYNAIAAASVGLAYGIDLATIVRGIESVTQVPGRMERIECGQPFAVYVDYAHTPDALETVLGAIRAVTPGQIITVFGAGGDRDARKRPKMAAAVEARSDVVVITNDNPRSEDPEEIVAGLLRGMKAPSMARILLDRAKAIAWACEAAQPGDSILIAGKGHEACQVVGANRFYFDDRETVRDCLYDRAAIELAC